jgi:hypothetical protein
MDFALTEKDESRYIGLPLPKRIRSLLMCAFSTILSIGIGFTWNVPIIPDPQSKRLPFVLLVPWFMNRSFQNKTY